MAINFKNKFMFSAKELRNHLNEEGFRSLKPEQGFIKWYIHSRFGHKSEFKFLDGQKDGGADAYVENRGRIFIIQSKYEVVPRISNVFRDEIASFERLADRFINEDEGAGFEKWLMSVKPDVRSIYRSVRRKAQENPNAVSFVFITTKKSTYSSQAVQIEDIQHISSLWSLYQEGFTPPADSIELRMDDVWDCPSGDRKFTTFVGIVDIREFLNLMNVDENERLFAQNVRTDLRSRINREIRSTYEREPEKFWLGNNGIYIICRNVVPVGGKKYRLIFPSIINGSQTLHSIHASETRHSCKILVRILQMDTNSDLSLLSAVIRRTNTQNPMKLVNLSAHDPYQLNIARYLDRFKIFYERREKEWQTEKKMILLGYLPIDIKTVAQWLSTQHSDIGFGRARSRPADLFITGFYKKIFENFDRNLSSCEYRDLATIVWAGMFINNLISEYPKNYRPYPRMAQLLLLRVLYDSIKMIPDNRDYVDVLLKQHRFGQKRIPRQIKSFFKKAINNLIKLQKARQRKYSNIDFSNFFKRDDLAREGYQKVFSNISIKKLSKIMKATRSNIS